MATYKFVVNDDSIVNEYGYRVMTNGIDTIQYERNSIVLYMHNRAVDDPQKVVGKTVNLTIEGSQLIAEIEFDGTNEFSKTLEAKVAGGFIKMASIFADVKDTSIDAKDVLPDQKYETVTASKLIEISIVDVGGNDNALKLSRGGNPVQLKKITKSENKDMSIKTIALAMGLNEDAGNEGIVKAYNTLKLSLSKAEAKVSVLEAENKVIKTGESDALIEQGVKLGLIDEDLKDIYVTSFQNDFEATKVKLSKKIEETLDSKDLDDKNKGLTEVMLRQGGQGGQGKTVKLTYDYLQKYNSKELKRLHEENNEEYVRLAKEYENGVRHSDK